jgi:hypothetical protein
MLPARRDYRCDNLAPEAGPWPLSACQSSDCWRIKSNCPAKLAFVKRLFLTIFTTFANPALMQPICGDDLHASRSGTGILALRAELVTRLP